MNDKITFPRLSSLLADMSGRSKRFSEDFLREFFALISENLEAGESVKIKGLGTFRLARVEPRRSVDVTTGQPMEISGHSKVVFVPAKELAETVNAPFEAFSAIEISDDTDISQLFSKDEIDLQDSDDTEEEGPDIYPVTPIGPVSFADASDCAPEERTSGFIGQRNASGEDLKEQHIMSTKETAADSKSFEEKASDPHEEEEAPGTSEDEETSDPHEEEEATGTSEDEKTSDSHEEEEATGTLEDEEASYPHEEENAPETSKAKETSEPLEEEDAIDGDLAEEEFDPSYERRRTWVRTLMISLGAAVFALVATFVIWYVFATNDFNGIRSHASSNAAEPPKEGFVVGRQPTPSPTILDDSISEEDTADETIAMADEPEVPTTPSDVIVYDTISTTRFLTTMAKLHYGNYNLWPYIYEENKAILGHPDRIRPGTPVVIPKLSKFGIDPTNESDIEKAKRMGVEIYSRYGKKI